MKAAAVAMTGGSAETILCTKLIPVCNHAQLLPLNRTQSLLPALGLGSAVSINRESGFPKSQGRLRLKVACGVPDSAQAQPSTITSSQKSIVNNDEFSLAKVSFGVIGLGLGTSLLSYGFGAYFNILPGSEWSALMLTYGFPLAILGMAFKYAELKPVPCVTYSDAEVLRETCATPILKQVRSDVIRYRYGDEQHLEEALKRIFQYGQGGGISRRSAPILQMIREEVTEDGKYCLVLVFEAKALRLSDFEKRQEKFASFFGPGVSAEIVEGDKNLYEVRLISNTTL
ncbi:unnamed protein product [Cuscuta europaea]|uniref:Thylakoid membrane protein slr0575 n=1 Tax=Cuscuta europaea TaxID=41803 RepID=A0A9P1EGL8_CUSEU|nr:unnamed protein product [Cuscuta europaea]